MYPPAAKCAGGGDSENAGGIGGGAGGGGARSGRCRRASRAVCVNEYASGPANGFACFFQQRLHGRSGSEFLYPMLWPARSRCSQHGCRTGRIGYAHLSHSWCSGYTRSLPSLSSGWPITGCVVGRPSSGTCAVSDVGRDGRPGMSGTGRRPGGGPGGGVYVPSLRMMSSAGPTA